MALTITAVQVLGMGMGMGCVEVEFRVGGAFYESGDALLFCS